MSYFSSLQKFQQAVVAMMAWVAAIFAPIALATTPHGQSIRSICIASVFIIALSCYFGNEARRSGSKMGFRLKTVVPLTLLAISAVCVIAVITSGWMLGDP